MIFLSLMPGQTLVSWSGKIEQAAQTALIMACLLTLYSGINYLGKILECLYCKPPFLNQKNEQNSSLSGHAWSDWH